MMKMKWMLVALTALSLNLAACSEDDVDRAVADVPETETRESLMKIEEGAGNTCPDIAGKYSCADEGSTDAREIEYKQETDAEGRQVFSQSGATPATDKSLVASAFEQYVMTIDGGIVSDGKVQDLSVGALGATVPLKYVVSCSGGIFSLHVITGDNGFRTTVEKNDDGLVIESWGTDGDKVESGKANCKKI